MGTKSFQIFNCRFKSKKKISDLLDLSISEVYRNNLYFTLYFLSLYPFQIGLPFLSTISFPGYTYKTARPLVGLTPFAHDGTKKKKFYL